MKIQIASDLHLEFVERRFPGYTGIRPAPDAEVLVLAGDIHNRLRGMELFATWPVPVIYVPGNHEYFGTDYRTQREAFKCADAWAFPSVIALDHGIFEYKGVRFVGTTLWTDFNLYGQNKRSRRLAATRIYDYRTIRLGHKPLQTRDTLREHTKAVEWLDRVLDEPFHGATVVVARYEFLTKRRAEEAENFEQLESQASNWERAARLRNYADAAERQAIAAGGVFSAEHADWLAWARAKADWLDPLVQVSDVILDAPEPKRPSFWPA